MTEVQRNQLEILLTGRHLRKKFNDPEMGQAKYLAYLGPSGNSEVLAILSLSEGPC